MSHACMHRKFVKAKREVMFVPKHFACICMLINACILIQVTMHAYSLIHMQSCTFFLKRALFL